MKRTYEEWYHRTSLLAHASDLPPDFVHDFLARRRTLRRLYEQQYGPVDVLMHLQRKHAALCRFHERGRWYREHRKWVQYAAYKVGYDLHKPTRFFAVTLVWGAVVVTLIGVAGLIVWGLV